MQSVPDYQTQCKNCPRLARVLAINHDLQNALQVILHARHTTRKGARLIAEAYRLEGEQLERIDKALRLAMTTPGGEA